MDEKAAQHMAKEKLQQMRTVQSYESNEKALDTIRGPPILLKRQSSTELTCPITGEYFVDPVVTCDGMTYEEIQDQYPQEAAARRADKFTYRYPRGESYLDLIARLDPLMHELESYKEPLLVVSHQATLRVLYSYLVGGERRDAPKVEIPLHTLIKITWDGWRSIREERIAMEDFTVGLQDDGQKNH